jgi:hypothetical protein
VPDGQGLAESAQDDLLVGDQPPDPEAVHADALDVGAARALQRGRGGVGDRARAGPSSRVGDQGRGARGGARGRVRLVGVVQLHHLDGLEVRRGLGGEAHHQHRAEREVRGDQHARGRGLPQPTSDLVQPVGVEPGRADHGVDAVLDAVVEVVHHRVGMGEVHDGLGAGLDEHADVVARVHLRDELEVVGGRDRPADLRADLAPGTQHSDPHDVRCHVFTVVAAAPAPGPGPNLMSHD